MSTIESTPEMAEALYARMERNLAVVRERLGKPLTLADKILLGHLDDPHQQELVPGKSYLHVRPDRVVFQDVLGQSGMLQFMQTGRDRVAVPASIHCDHLIQARVEGEADLAASRDENDEVYALPALGGGALRPRLLGAGRGHHPSGRARTVRVPGRSDHRDRLAHAQRRRARRVRGRRRRRRRGRRARGLPWEVLYPKHIAVYLTGSMSGWTAPKDVILYVAGKLTVSGGTNAIVEYIGPGARTISATGKATITNMGAELGATTSLFPYDEKMATYLRATDRAGLVAPAERYAHLLRPDDEVEARPHDFYDVVVELDLSTLEPHVVGPHTPDRARPISELAAEVRDPKNGFVDAVATALIGSCTNSSYEDMSRAADVAAQAKAHGVGAQASFLVTPGSETVRATIERDGQLETLREAGATVLANACGPCIGQWRRDDTRADAPNTIVTSYNRNFPRRNDDRATTMNFIASPEIVTAFAIAGRLSFDPRRDTLAGADGQPFSLEAPKPAPEVPSQNFARGRDFYVAPPEDGRSVELSIDPNSTRLAALEPWPPWHGRDFVDLPVLLKTSGKTTTDHISPAGKWLTYRGHLEKFSDNMFMGANNAFTGEPGTTTHVDDGERASVATVARRYRAAGVNWVAVGDFNYGEGSSREHAALSPRLLGGVAVIARSFARIHETNLKKQGLLALTFRDPADYERIREGDRISLVGLSDLAPGVVVTAYVKHSDGTSDTLALNHTFNAAQLAWFRAGSALNALRAG